MTGYLLAAAALTASPTIPAAAISGNIAGNAANVTGIVPAANGDTGAAALTGYLLGTGTSALTATPIIPIVNGGMGAATAVAAIVALLPAQTSLFNGYVLSTNGTLASWNAASTGAVTRLHQNPLPFAED